MTHGHDRTTLPSPPSLFAHCRKEERRRSEEQEWVGPIGPEESKKRRKKEMERRRKRERIKRREKEREKDNQKRKKEKSLGLCMHGSVLC